MNKSLSLVITLTVVIIITVVMTYFDLMDMDRNNTRQELGIKEPSLRLTRHNQPIQQTGHKQRIKSWNKTVITSNGEHLVGKAYLLYRDGKLKAAEETVRTALILLPQNSNALALLGRILYETGRYDLAEQIFNEQVKLRGSTAAYNNLGEAMARQGRYQDAIKIFNIANQDQPDSPTINLNLAGLHSISGHKNSALQFFRKAFNKLGYKIIPISHDQLLNNIRSETEFKAIIKAAKKMQPK